jgi:hypothetical protein
MITKEWFKYHSFFICIFANNFIDMINQVYTTVLAIINKDNRGYVSPLEFNLYAELAQMSLFEELFHKYSKSIVKQNARMYHSEYSDIPKHIREVIDVFTNECKLSQNLVSLLWYPNTTDFYRLIKIDYLQKELEEISKLEVNRVLNNNLIAPTLQYPAYISLNGGYRLYPTTIVGANADVTYIRKPKQPKWTYQVVGGNPLFNPTATDYQDFEFPESMFNDLVVKILGYAGVEIREADIIQVSQGMEVNNNNQEQL